MTTIEIRAARAGEEEALMPLYEWLFAAPGSQPPAWDERRAAVALRQAIDSRDACVLVAEDGDGELVGICTAYQDLHSVRFGNRVWVEDLAVHPQRRSQGVGRRLLEAARDWARERGATPPRARFGRDAARGPPLLRARRGGQPLDQLRLGPVEPPGRVCALGRCRRRGRAEAGIARA